MTADPDPTPEQVVATFPPLTDDQCARIGSLLVLARHQDEQPGRQIEEGGHR